MGQEYIENKIHIYNHRIKNKAKYNEYQREFMKNKKNNPYFEFEKISRVFRRILF
jgi:hypothetical protein